MPPALSDSEGSDVDMPVRGGPQYPKDDDLIAEADGADAAEDSGSGSDDEDEDVFVVEEIKQHLVDQDGDIKFQIKWEGYPAKKDWTWESEENLQESANEILEAYYEKVGGRDAVLEQSAEAGSKKKRGRQSGAAAAGSKRVKKNGHPDSSTPPVSSKRWVPPSGSWEDEIALIDACEQEDDGRLVVYLNWKNGQKTKHETDVIYKKCPQKMLQFYERHVKIVKEAERAGGG